MKKKLTLDDYMNGAADLRSAASVRLRHALRRRRGVSGLPRGRGEVARPAGGAHPRRPSSGTMRFRTIRSRFAAAGRWMSTSCGRWPASSRTTSICVETYDDYPVIITMQFEDLGFCAKGEGPDFVRAAHLHHRRHVPAQHLGRAAVGRAGGRRRRLSRPHRSDAAADRHADRQAGQGREARRRLRLRHDQLRPRPVVRRRCAGEGVMTEPLTRPKRKDPLKRTRQPLLSAVDAQPHRARADRGGGAKAASSCRSAPTAARCSIRRATPARSACRPRVPFKPVDNRGTLLAETTIRTSTDPYFRERMPWRVGLVKARLRSDRSVAYCMATSAKASACASISSSTKAARR